MRYILILKLVFIWSQVYAQVPIYLFENRYEDQNVKKLINDKNYYFKKIKILGQYMIDPKREGHIDYGLVERYLKELYPRQDADGTLCINLEGKLFTDLRDNFGNSVYRKSLNEYVKLVKYVKHTRPHVTVGVYGLPFTIYYSSQKVRNRNDKLELLLKEVDIIFPSLYLFYPDKQKGIESNFEYFKKNLETAFSYGDKFNKPVIPFIWYLVHPSNKRFRYEMLTRKEIDTYLNFISSYKSMSGSNVEGIVWWDTPTPFKTKDVKTNLLIDNPKKFNGIDDAFLYYFDIKK